MFLSRELAHWRTCASVSFRGVLMAALLVSLAFNPSQISAVGAQSPRDTTSPSFATQLTVERPIVAPGGTQEISGVVTSQQAVTVAIDLALWDEHGVLVHDVPEDLVDFEAGETKTYTMVWDVPAGAAAAPYTVQFGVYSPDWVTNYAWNDQPGLFSVMPSASSTTMTSPAPAAIAAPPKPTATPMAPAVAPTQVGMAVAPAKAPFSTRVRAGRRVVAPGETQKISAAVTSQRAVSVAIDLALWDEHSALVRDVAADGVHFRAGETKTYTMVWSVPAGTAAGPYTVQFGVYSPDWVTNYAWNDQPALFSVISSPISGPTRISSPALTAAPPTATRTATASPTATASATATATATATTTTPPTATSVPPTPIPTPTLVNPTVVPTAAQGAAALVSVDTSAQQGSVRTRLSTNLVTPGMVDTSPGARGLLGAWAPPLVRLHAGSNFDSGSPPALPAGSQEGDWNFGPLDQMAGAVRSYGGEPVLNVRYAPNWMWTCSELFNQGAAGVGGLRDPSFSKFGEYMARLVGWYNKGGFTDERGVVHRSGHQGWVSTWEVWNEPNLSGETPCHPVGGGASLSADQYVAMWNVVVPKMLAVDPSIKLVGPGTSGFDAEYIQALMQRTQRPPDVLSYHVYGGGSNAQADHELFDGLVDLTAGTTTNWGRPMWVSELNVNSASEDDPHGRPSGPFGVAWGASAFRMMVLGGIELAHQFEFVTGSQFGLLNLDSGAPQLPYWRDLLLTQAFPAGSTVVRSTSSVNGIETLAARRSDGSLAVLVINRQLAGSADVGGSGVPTRVTVHLQGLTPSVVSLRQIDRTTDAAHPPTSISVPPATDLVFSSPGYGMALLEIPPR